MYHLSDVMKHDHAYTSAVVDHLQISNPEIIRLKSDNCATQYKCKSMFKYYSSLSAKEQKNIIVYYGASGHGKGLVDAMSGFGVKGPICKTNHKKLCI